MMLILETKNSILNLWEDVFGDCVELTLCPENKASTVVYDIFLSRFDNGAPEKTKPIKEEDYQTMVLARLTHDIHIISTL